MLRKFIVALGALAVSGWAATAAPLEAYGKLPSIQEVELSPSGALVAYVLTDGEKRNIAIQTTADRNLNAAFSAGNIKVRDLRWAGDEHLIITTSTTTQPFDVYGPRVERYLAYDFNLKTKRSRPLLGNMRSSELTMNTVSGYPEVRMIDGKPVAFVRGTHFVEGQGELGLFRIDLTNDAAKLYDPGKRDTNDWVVDSQGRVVAQSLYDDKTGVWTLMVRAAPGGWRMVQTVTAPIETPELIGLGRDEKSIVVELSDDKAGDTWRELSLESGTWGDRLDAWGAAIPDPANGRLIGHVALDGDSTVYNFYDTHDAAVWRGVTKAFPGDIVTLESWSYDRKKIIVRVDSAEEGPAYALVDLTTGKADWLGNEYEGLTSRDISPVKPVRYKAADGLEITGYLTLPRGRDPHGLPLLVLPHGGPASRDRPGFDWWAQALASHGYAVLQPNFRGSTGFSAEFLAAGFGEWGRKMQTDLSDGVRYLAHEGVIDPKRVCIVGASYGGYAALAGATIDHGVYRCAVSVGGVTDLRDLVSDFRDKEGLQAQRYWFRFIGSSSGRDPVMVRYSPVTRAAEAEVPILLIHGKDDTVVPIKQSRRMADALRAAGKPVELIELPGEDHWLSTGETRLQMLQATVAFLEKNNPPN